MRKPKIIGLIRFNETAVETGVAIDALKVIQLVEIPDGAREFKDLKIRGVYPFHMREELSRQFPLKDETIGQTVPPETTFAPTEWVSLGFLNIRKILPVRS